MIIYLLNIALMFFWYYLFEKKYKSKKTFVILSAIQWILLIGLRDLSIGGIDVQRYVNHFNSTVTMTWKEVFDEFIDIFFYGQEGKDPGYRVIVKLLSVFSKNYRVFLFITGMIFIIPMSIFIYKYSKNTLLSFVLFSTVFYSFYALTGFRQTVATSIVVFMGYEYIVERRFSSFLLISIVAFTIHKSSIVFFAFYFLNQIRINSISIILYLMAGILFFFFGAPIYNNLAVYIGYTPESYASVGGAVTYFIMILLITIFSLIRYNQVATKTSNHKLLYNAILTTFILVLLTFNARVFMRLQQYYALFIIILIPEVVETFSIKEKQLIYLLLYTILLFLFIRTNPNYIFFFKEF